LLRNFRLKQPLQDNLKKIFGKLLSLIFSATSSSSHKEELIINSLAYLLDNDSSKDQQLRLVFIAQRRSDQQYPVSELISFPNCSTLNARGSISDTKSQQSIESTIGGYSFHNINN